MRGWSAVTVAAMALSLACSAETDDDDTSIEDQSAAFRTAVEANQVKYEQWEAAGQHDSIMAVYTEDAIAAFGNQPVLMGRAAILANAMQMAGLGTPSLDLRTVSAMANGPLGVEYGTYVYNMTLSATAPAGMAAMFPDSGSYMAHWHLMDGQWKIASLVVNSMKPLPGMEAMMAPAPQQ
jgi:ketosteroid isomerase-like protein